MNKVYFYALSDGAALTHQINAMRKLAEVACMKEMIKGGDFVALKIHVGEAGNTTHVKPELVKAVAEMCLERSKNVFLTETATLYKGERDNAIKHLLHAERHGFGIQRIGVPFIMADGLTGSSEMEVTINGELEHTVKIAREIAFADDLVVVSHPTGHLATGLGAALKNLGMGLASRAGKLRQHSSVSPVVSPGMCRLCKKCAQWCPAEAIVEEGGKAKINAAKCIGCGECFTVCRYDAVKYNWGAESSRLQKSMVEHAYGAVKGKEGRCLYFNALVDMTKDCDCISAGQSKLIPDLGIMVSTDPVAVDKATLDMTARANGKSLAEMAYGRLDPMVQLRHGVKLGMGDLEYELVNIN